MPQTYKEAWHLLQYWNVFETLTFATRFYPLRLHSCCLPLREGNGLYAANPSDRHGTMAMAQTQISWVMSANVAMKARSFGESERKGTE